MMRIGIDARILLATPPGAHAAMLRELLLANANRALPHEFVLYTDDPRHSPGVFTAPNVTLRCVRRRGSDLLWLNLELPAELRRDRIDVYYSCFYKIPLLTRIPRVNMVHDTAFFNLPRHLLTGRHRSRARRIALWLMLALHCRAAARTITVSEFSKKSLLEWLPVPAHRIAVCYNPVSAAFYPAGDEPVPADGYCLFIGSAIPKKNVTGTLKAFGLIPEAIADRYPLVLRTTAAPEYTRLAEMLGIAGRVRFLDSFLTFEQMAALVKRASLLVLLSHEEGFGLPVAEAMAARVPVLVSDAAALEEITGGAGVDPASPHAVAARWERLLTDDDARRRAIQAGAARAELFHPERICPQLLDLITTAACV